MGRKKIDIDWNRVDKLLQAQCSGLGIASLLGLHEDTLYRRCELEKKQKFQEYAAQKKGEGLELLKAKQFQTALSGNITMQIWLGKQYLGQNDKVDHTSKGESIRPIEINVTSQENSDNFKKIIDRIAQFN